MNFKEHLKNDILVGMANHLDHDLMAILEHVITSSLQGLEITKEEFLPATVENTNEYIIKLFYIKKANKLSSKTVESYMHTLKEFITYSGKSLLKVTENDIELFLYHKQKAGSSNVTLNNNLRNISAFFTWMRKNKLISCNPCDAIEPYPVDKKPVEYLDAVDMDLIRKSCTNAKQRAMVEFLRSTGLRRGEVPQIRIGDIDFASGKIVVRGEKNRTYRTVFLDKLSINYLKIYLGNRIENKEEQVFITKFANREFNGRDVYDIIHPLALKLGITKLHPHIFRSTVATNICKRGGTEDMAGNYLGHTPKTVTGLHYIGRAEEDKEEIFRNFVQAV